jgi:hypothetical protein
MTLSTALSTALGPPRWALGFVWRHPVMVFGLSLVPALERFTGQLTERDPALGIAFEVTTLAVRLLLVALVVRIAIIQEPLIGRLQGTAAGGRLQQFAQRHGRAIALQSTLLVGLFVLADLVPEQLVPALTPVGPLYWATLLAVKNLTVIPFTMIWLIGAVRQALLAPDPEAASPAR